MLLDKARRHLVPIGLLSSQLQSPLEQGYTGSAHFSETAGRLQSTRLVREWRYPPAPETGMRERRELTRETKMFPFSGQLGPVAARPE